MCVCEEMTMQLFFIFLLLAIRPSGSLEGLEKEEAASSNRLVAIMGDGARRKLPTLARGAEMERARGA